MRSRNGKNILTYGRKSMKLVELRREAGAILERLEANSCAKLPDHDVVLGPT